MEPRQSTTEAAQGNGDRLRRLPQSSDNHPGLRFVDETRSNAMRRTHDKKDSEKARNEYCGELYKLVDNGRTINEAYTPLDHCRIGVASALETLASIPGTPREWRGKSDCAKRLVESRILSECITRYRDAFREKLNEVEERRAYCRGRLDAYATKEKESKEIAMTADVKARACEELNAILHAELERMGFSLHNAPSIDEAHALSKTVAAKKKQERDSLCAVGDHVSDANLNTQLAMLYAVQYTSMEAQYECVREQRQILHEKHSHIGAVLEDYEAGASIADNALLQRTVDDCRAASEHLYELDERWTAWHRQCAEASSLPAKELLAAYTNSQQSKERRYASMQHERHRVSQATLRVVLD